MSVFGSAFPFPNVRIKQPIPKKQLSFNLNEYSGSEFVNLIFSYYDANPHTNIDLRFSGRYNFRIGIAEMLILFIVNNEHQDMIQLLNAHPRKFKHVRPAHSTFILLRRERGLLKIEDFQIIEQMWKFHHDIKSIQIVSHNIIFTRSSPQRLQDICLNLLDEESLSILPTHVVKRLEDCCVEKLKSREGNSGEDFLNRMEKGHAKVENNMNIYKYEPRPSLFRGVTRTRILVAVSCYILLEVCFYFYKFYYAK